MRLIKSQRKRFAQNQSEKNSKYEIKRVLKVLISFNS